MSLIVDYGGGSSSPPTADIIFASDLSRISSQSSTEEELSPLPLVPSSSLLDEGSSTEFQCSGHGFSSQPHLLGNSSLGGASVYRGDPLSAPYHGFHGSGTDRSPSDPLCAPFPGYHGPGSDGSSHGARIASKAVRRRKRSPPASSKFDINDNSLHSVYSFFKNFLSASTASTVAIDNKIEQAMDLVKSHLMFAVREEVDVLKERIGELMERINHLEYENTVLRKYASPEVLQQLQHPSANP